jgi:hypothetical protein
VAYRRINKLKKGMLYLDQALKIVLQNRLESMAG